ncbi:Kinase, NEK [Giardia muris]|uniref:Kinase, NEK n=1 Tax=Giardia muris TaxID=5742 RepID=A0A4Z1TBX6_GIAMU|nr:Kinase, NEK [Giardia muris]|eukprot:TNJ30039.1 Kinase, NEK [Giardia muris]
MRSFENAYEKLLMIECGGFGKVYKCKDLATGVIYAVKEVDYAGVPQQAVSRVKGEVNLMLRLAHPNILKPIEFFDDEEAETLYIVMDFYERGDLSKLIRKYRKEKKLIPESMVWCFLSQSLDALKYLHSGVKGESKLGIILHRDIKPQNILIGEGDRIKVMDFGISRESATFMIANTTMGTPSYLAPEVLQDKPFSTKSDIWALGLTILELCMRQRTFVGEPAMVIKQHQDFPEKITLPEGYSDDLATIVSFMLRKNQMLRLSATELLEHPILRVHTQAPISVSCLTTGYTDLMQCAIKGNMQGCIDCIGQAKQVDPEGKTALMLAAEYGHCHIITSLYAHERGIKMHDGTTALRLALKNGNWDAARLLKDEEGPFRPAEAAKAWDSGLEVRYGAGVTDLMRACAANDIVSAWHLKTKEAGSQTSKGYSALMICAEHNCFEIGRMLTGIESLLRNGDGLGAIHLATLKGSLDILPFLVKHEGGMLTAQKETSLHLCARNNLTDAAQILIVKEAGYKTKEGKLAFDIAMENGFKFLARILATKEGKGDLLNTTDLKVPGSSSFLLDDEGGAPYSSAVGVVTRKFSDACAQKPTSSLARSSLNNTLLGQPNRPARTSPLAATPTSGLSQNGLGDDGSHLTPRTFQNSPDLPSCTVGAPSPGVVVTTARTAVKSTPLIDAVHARSVDGVEQNLRYARQTDGHGMTALMYAAQYGDLELVKLLMDKEAGVLNGTKNALAYALLNKHEKVAALLTTVESAKRVPMPSGLHFTALMSAAQEGNVAKACSLLYQAGCPNTDGTTALMLAAQYGHTDVVQILAPLERGMMRYDGSIAYKLARAGNHIECYKILHPLEKVARDKYGDTQLMVSASANDVKGVADHLHMARFTNIKGKTALMIAAEAGYIEIVRLLAVKEARMQMVAEGWQSGATALILAARAGRVDVVQVLTELEGNMTDSKGWFAMAVAAQKGHTDVVKILLEKERNMRFRDGATAMPIAAQYGQTEIVRMMIPFYNRMQRSDGETALIRAATYGKAECVKLLAPIEYGLTKTDGRTALMIAAARGYQDCVEILTPYEQDLVPPSH